MRTQQQNFNIRIAVTVHRETKLMVATSPDMKGLFVHGRTDRELEQRIPQAIQALLEAEGYRNVVVKAAADDDLAAPDFIPTHRRFEAEAIHG